MQAEARSALQARWEALYHAAAHQLQLANTGQGAHAALAAEAAAAAEQARAQDEQVTAAADRCVCA